MANKIRNFFLDDEPPAQVQEQPVQPVIAPQNISMGTPVDVMAETPAEQPVPEQVPPAATTDQPQTGGFKYLTPEEIKQQIADNRTNPLLAMIKANEPKIDEKQQERLRRIAAINSAGQGLATILQGYYGKKGANIPVVQNNLLPEVYRQYMENQKNYETRLEANRAQQLAAQMQGLDIAQGQIAQERQLKAADERTKAGQAFQKEQQGAAWEQQEKMAKIQFDQQLTLFNKQAQKEMERMAKQHGYQKALQAMSQAFQSSEAKKSRDFQSDLYEKGYKGKTGSGSWRGQNAGGAFVYIDKSGQKQVLNSGQDEWIDYVLSKVMSDRTKYYRNRDMLDKYAQGKITENEARQLMSQYADEYLDINKGVAYIKGKQPTQEPIEASNNPLYPQSPTQQANTWITKENAQQVDDISRAGAY